MNIKDFLDFASAQYYKGDPVISDDQFDHLADSIGYGSVGAKQHENVEKHVHRMYSLQKYYEDEGAESPLKNEKDKCTSIKLDGAAIDILYIDGKLVRVLTRGDGFEGRVITDKFLATNIIPKEIKSPHPVVQVIGEICASKTIENSRNYAAGALNLKDVEEFRTRAVEFFAYGVYPYHTDTYDKDMAFLKCQGFNTVQDPDLHEIYPSDGLVFRVNSNARFEELGYTAKHPRGAFALKQRAEVVETTLLSVEWGVGRGGRVTPVAILEPVMIGDATISRATLNNPGFIEALDLCIGDRVALRRSGEIIPQILYKVE